MLGGIAPAEKETPEGKREFKVTQMLLDEPHIEPKAPEAITALSTIRIGSTRPWTASFARRM